MLSTGKLSLPFPKSRKGRSLGIIPGNLKKTVALQSPSEKCHTSTSHSNKSGASRERLKNAYTAT